MNTKRIFLTTSFASAVLASTMVLGTAAYASPNGGKHCGGKHGGGKHGGKPTVEMMQKRLDRMAYKLGLSDAQKQQLITLKENKRNNMKPLREQGRALSKQIAQLDPKASDYDQKLAGIANTKAELTRSKIIAKGEMRKQMANILTPEQQAKMKELRKNRKGGSRHGKGKRHGHDQS